MSRDKKPSFGPQPISRILETVLQRYGLHERLEERAVLLKWRDVVGEKIAGHSRAVDLEDGVLYIEADHGAWRHEVTMLIPMIMEKFNAMCGEGTVKEIQWRNRSALSRKHYKEKNRKR